MFFAIESPVESIYFTPGENPTAVITCTTLVNVAIANALQLEVARRHASLFSL